MEEFILKKPLLFMVFNRPEKTEKVFSQIKKVRPMKLYLSCDAPRIGYPNDQTKVDQVKSIISDINWPCDVKRLYHEQNQGCSQAGYMAFNWIFNYEDEMIQLEDDCFPSITFFRFCEENLDRYKFDERVCYITANNNSGIKIGDASYFFSRFGGSWGFATWKRVWNKWDYRMKDWKSVKNLNSFKSNFLSREQYKYFKYHLNLVSKGFSNTYDWQTLYMIYRDNLVNIYPNHNLVQNIGWDEEATNTKTHSTKFKTPFVELESIIHPKEVSLNLFAENVIFKYHWQDHLPLSFLKILRNTAKYYIFYPLSRKKKYW